MVSEIVQIFQPRDVKQYSVPDGIEKFLAHLFAYNNHHLEGQFNLFPYLRPDIEGRNWDYAGLIYRRSEKDVDEPLNFVSGNEIINSARALALKVGGNHIGEPGFFNGRFEIPCPTSEQLVELLNTVYSPKHKDYAASGLREPDRVVRFFLNLEPDNCQRLVVSILEDIGYNGRIRIESVD